MFSLTNEVGLMTVLKNIVLGDYTMVEVALMLVEPENQEVVFIEQETQEDVAKECETQEDVARECETQDDVAIKTNKCLQLKNLVSKLKPKTKNQEVVFKDQDLLSKIKRKTGTKAFASNTKKPKVLHIKQKKLWYQKKVQQEIETVLGKMCSNLSINEEKLRSVDLKTLGLNRRSLLFPAVVDLIHAVVIGGVSDLNYLLGFPEKCRLFGLRMNLYNELRHLPFIESAIVEDGTCILTALDKSETKYKIMPDGIWQYNADDSTAY
ncbi:uncharacterized protein LOC126846037 [Adelges cooleyi]|uniref:uncharacterized protein LOC126833803 n=1 Tax=Adelges cooleyi TaxID=133065 RepID=UPI00217F689E|nr:uncharacterized protein LOC126833803 [Adelges cooleyi]XP_050441076.1 uncharacterized protein LOC126846037 [Adelges cooleyi]